MRAYHFLVTITVAWSCGFCSIGVGKGGALPVTTDLHAHGLNEQQLDSLADIMQQAFKHYLRLNCSLARFMFFCLSFFALLIAVTLASYTRNPAKPSPKSFC